MSARVVRCVTNLQSESSGKRKSLDGSSMSNVKTKRSSIEDISTQIYTFLKSKLRLVTLSKMFAAVKQKGSIILRGLQFYVNLMKNEEGNNIT